MTALLTTARKALVAGVLAAAPAAWAAYQTNGDVKAAVGVAVGAFVVAAFAVFKVTNKV